MLPTRDLLHFKARYRLRYSKAKEEEGGRKGSDEGAPTDSLTKDVPEPS